MNIKLLEQMVALNSIYPNEQSLGKFLCKFLRQNGFRVDTQGITLNRFNIFASKGRGGKFVLFYGHLDTVPLTNLSKWKTNPFQLTEKRGRLYGLGAYDMKGGIVAFLDACIQTKRNAKIFLAVDEEWISEGAWNAVKYRKKFFSDVDLIISPEPNFGVGTHGILRGRTGRYIFTVNFEGKPSHVARYRDSVDAIEMTGQFTSDFYEAREKLFLSRGTFAQIRKIAGEAVGMSVCGNSSVEVEVFGSDHDSVLTIQRQLQSLTRARVRLKSRKTPYLSGYFFRSFTHKEIISDIIRRNTGKPMELHTRVSVGDDNVLATLGISVITWGPNGGNAHAPNEYVNKSSLDILSKMFLELLAS